MMDTFDAHLRQRMTHLLAAVPVEPAPEPGRARTTTARRHVRKRLVLAVGLGLLLLTSLAVSVPTQSRPTYEARKRALGVPDGAEVVFAGGTGRDLLFVAYRDKSGQIRCNGDCRGIWAEDRNGNVTYEGPPYPDPTPRP